MDKNFEKEVRRSLRGAQRIVIKIGTRVLTNAKGRLEESRIKSLASEIARLHNEGREVLFVTSGAIGRGLDVLELKARPKTLPELQMAAAVGQLRLMSDYDLIFSKYGIKTAQVLLTHDDLHDRRRHLNVRNTINSLLRNKVLPIINENDVVSVNEIKVGDNDMLAALTGVLVDAQVLLLLSTVSGFKQPSSGGKSERVPYLEKVTKKQLQYARGTSSAISIGGMGSKLEAAQLMVDAGYLSVIADGRRASCISAVFNGKDVGTLIGELNSSSSIGRGKKKWLAVFQRAQGSLEIDEGAIRAIHLKGKSLLPAGVKSVTGSFEQGALVNILDGDGKVIARGLVDYNSRDIQKIKGLKTSEIETVLGAKYYDEVVHRDNMVVLKDTGVN